MIVAGVAFLILGLLCGVAGFLYYRNNGFLWEPNDRITSDTDLFTQKTVYTANPPANRKVGGIIILVFGAFFLVAGAIAFVRAEIGPKDIVIDGVDISFPCTYQDIQALGFDIEEGQEIVEIKGTSNSYNRSGKTYTVVDDSGRSFEIRFENDTTERLMATECRIYEMTFEYAPPKNMYADMSPYSSYGNTYFAYQQMGLSQEQINDAMEDYNDFLERQSEYYENYEILNSPKLTLSNDVNSDMSKAQVEGIMGNGQIHGFVTTSSSYHAVKDYTITRGSKYFTVTITYVTKDEIAKITISQ